MHICNSNIVAEDLVEAYLERRDTCALYLLGLKAGQPFLALIF